jgi:hypothetical protein
VIGVQPNSQALYYWSTTANAFVACPNSSTALASAATPEPIALYGLNAGLNQWTPVTSCPGTGGSGTPGGLNGQIQYNNEGAFGGLGTNGTGNVALTTGSTQYSTVLVAPTLGQAVGTSLNLTGVGLLASGYLHASNSTLGAASVSTLAGTGNWSTSGTMTATGFIGPLTGNVTGNVTGNATSSTSFSGSLSGDVTGTQGATLLRAIQGVSVPTLSVGCLQYLGGVLTWGACGSSGVSNINGVTGAFTFNGNSVNCAGTICTYNSAYTGTVTSITITVPAWMTATGCSITTSGTCAITSTSSAPNLFLASPNGTPGTLALRGIVNADLPIIQVGGGGSGAINQAGAFANIVAPGGTMNNNAAIAFQGTGAATTLSNLGGAALTGAAFTGPVSVASTLSVANNTSIGPRYDVTQSGASGTMNACQGTVSAGSTALTVGAGCAFKKGNGIFITNAGTGGTTPFLTTVAADQVGTSITLGAPAISNAVTQWVYSDDTAAIQAAYDACLGSAVAALGNQSTYLVSPPSYMDENGLNGGIVEFPGRKQYFISSTINMHYGCQTEGITGGADGTTGTTIVWNGARVGTTATVTSFSITATAGVQIYNEDYATVNVYTAQFVATNNFVAGEWVQVTGMTTTVGKSLNTLVGQIASTGLSGAGFSIIVPFSWYGPSVIGSTSDTGKVTPFTVVMAFDQNATYQGGVSGINIVSAGTGGGSIYDQEGPDYPVNENPGLAAAAQSFDVGIYQPAKTRWISEYKNISMVGVAAYALFFGGGGDNTRITNVSLESGVVNIYWRPFSIGSLIVNDSIFGTDQATQGAVVIVDNSSCSNAFQRVTARNLKYFLDQTIPVGQGAFTFLGCPHQTNLPQFYFNMDSYFQEGFAASTGGINGTTIAVIPASDVALSLHIVNSALPYGTGANTTKPFIGMPSLLRNVNLGTAGFTSLLVYEPSLKSANVGSQSTMFNTPIQLIGDVNLSQIWQHGVQASALLYSSTGYSELPSGTTLFAGQVLAPPGYWNGSNGKRYALNVVYTSGTVGTLNSGSTTCTGTIGQSVMTCNSATGLSTGAYVTLGTDVGKEINQFDASNPSAVLVYFQGTLAASYVSPTALSYTAPVLGLEIQLPTKSAAAPTTLAWSQGDTEQNSGAVANGVAAWVNTGPGTPGTWAGIPLGDSSGKLAASQLQTAPPLISGTPTAGAGVCWKSATTLGTCTAGTWPNCSSCN